MNHTNNDIDGSAAATVVQAGAIDSVTIGPSIVANTIGTATVFDGPVTVHGDFTLGGRGKEDS